MAVDQNTLAVVPTIWSLLQRATNRLQAYGVDEARFQAELLLAYTLNVTRTQILASGPRRLGPEVASRYDTVVAHRCDRRPLQQITGRQEFWALEFNVTPDVLIPRPETEHAVETVIEILDAHPGTRQIADIGTGSGCIAIAVAATRPQTSIIAIDRSMAALRVAQHNARQLVPDRMIRFVCGELLQPLRGARFDLIVSNPPYIPARDVLALAPEVRDFEPRAALDGGPDGLTYLRALLAGAHVPLRPSGTLVLEIGHDHRATVLRLAQVSGFRFFRVIADLAGISRVVALRRESAAGTWTEL